MMTITRRPFAALFIVPVLAITLSACAGSGSAVEDERLDSAAAVGDLAPSFDLPSADGGRVALPDDLGGRPALLYFSMGPG